MQEWETDLGENFKGLLFPPVLILLNLSLNSVLLISSDRILFILQITLSLFVFLHYS